MNQVLLDDDFCTIVEAIAKGRKIYRNIQKFVTYLLGTNATQVSCRPTCHCYPHSLRIPIRFVAHAEFR